jgi:dihydrofolate synthase/folylpolyglutamate synthase
MTPEEAEARLLSLELFGMRFGLDRMRRLMTTLGHPERSFQSVHVVGTNGKSSTTRMTAAILARHGFRTGTYLSPHLVAYSERIRVDDSDITPEQFAAAIARALRAAEKVDRGGGEDNQVTQFELLTAAAYSELAQQRVEAAVIEAGLGGRFDATNVIPSQVTVLTNVGLEHTRWLGPTVEAIAREKLDVLQPGTALILGPGMHPDAVAVAHEVAGERDAEIIVAASDPHTEVGALGQFQRRNFSVARAAAGAFLARVGGGRLDELAVAAAAADTRVPGRLQVVGEAPYTVLDGAHNPDGIAALAESLPELQARRAGDIGPTADVTATRSDRPAGSRVAVISILDDKNAAEMLRPLVAHFDHVVLTATHNPRALPPPTLASLLAQVGGPASEIVREPQAALVRARELAGPGGFVLATGSIYLIADLLAPRQAAGSRQRSRL